MKSINEHIPVYSLDNFISQELKSQQFQVEVFDARRHFSVKYPHRHDFFEVLYLMRGSGFHVIDGNRYEIKPPCVFFMSPGQAHKIEFSHDIDGYLFIFTADFYLANRSNQNSLIEFPFFYNLKQENPPLLLENESDIRFLEELFKRSISERDHNGDHKLDLLRSLLDIILMTCSSRYKTVENIDKKGRGHILVKQFYHLVEENNLKNLSLKEYADRLAVTPNHLTQTVKLLTGKTSSQIIKAKQILEIKRLLVHTNLSVAEIAHQLNFDDQSYFTKFFKRESGYLPLQYRNRTTNT
ncbi:AraC-like DNA-binding protein [Breznakibacter xylanolyticus]|uniref:AraC-like DNA-binding protein n=1 Tax=Breznakibacter xylanolyticus TaxID=990 RepID=A0A2W7NG56_9BACT|nr:AraC family transcriptional regulator [Breznakibacter xylanolyticus]MBN2743065.1 helix-turn-helix domain-containing protein [Marinilabiliaceae bacterium]PZX19375.1 AraC-like DNA-binding protein [Breznakibacter xylanolyticus]